MRLSLPTPMGLPPSRGACYASRMAIKPRPHHRLYIQVLRRMTPERRLAKSFALTDPPRMLFWSGVFPSCDGVEEGGCA